MGRIWGNPISRVVRSEVLNEERPCLIYLPTSYDETHTEYPVLYHLDGDEIQLEDMLGGQGKINSGSVIPEVIYVSVMNTDRTRDMAPVKTSYCENPGADRFLSFFSRELIPFTDENFRASQFRILCGQSYSSVFTLYALLEEPSLFNGYITSSLYFPQCKEFFMEKAEQVFIDNNFDDRNLFMTLGALDFQYNKDDKTDLAIKELIGIIRKNQPVGLKWEYKIYKDYGHCPEPSYGDGLQWIFNTRVPRSTGNRGV